jgi:peptidoglycan/xylan/chitin deacetylase (PgdA/CDA1 family)
MLNVPRTRMILQRARVVALCVTSGLMMGIAAQGCARIVKRYPPDAGRPPAHTESDKKFRPPAGAECRGPRELLDAGTVEEACDAATPPQWPAWSELQPPGLCYTVDEPCEGVADYVAYLTFDDGPSDWTAQFLDILDRKHVQATFFVNARGIKGAAGLDGSYRNERDKPVSYSRILKRIVDDGHVLGNHTADHLDLGTLSEDEIRSQLQENERLINRALLEEGGHTQPLALLRAPFGSPWFAEDRPIDDVPARQAAAGRVFREFGYNVLWNISSTDADEWAMGEAATKVELSRNRSSSSVSYSDKQDRIRSTVLDHPLVLAGKGIVVLMHDTHNATRDALPELIDGLRERGYTFATLEEQVVDQYGRSSLELTPGPAIDKRCGAERSRSCAAFTEPDRPSVCGRFWRAFMDLGGEETVGRPESEPFRRPGSQIVAQTFELGTLELHPELPESCDALLLPDP